MTVMQRVVKPRTQRARRALENREPKIIENTKETLFFHGQKTSEISRQCLKDLYALKKEHSKHLQKKNAILPFEDILPVERMSQKHDTSLFAFASHSKKRPHNIVVGRFFDHHILDMVEFGVEDFKGLADFKNAKVSSSTKPCLVFCGTEFDDDTEYKRIKNLFLDFFRGVEATEVRLQGFEHAILFTVFEGKLLLRSYRILLKKSGTRVPRVELEEIGPSLSLKVRRTKLASDDLFKTSCRQPKQLKPKKVKNMGKDVFGTKTGRIHMVKQDLGKLQTRKLKGLKKNIGKVKKSPKKVADSSQQGPSGESSSAEPMEVTQE